MPNSTTVAIFSVDPGGTSGCATALLDLRRVTVANTMKRAVAKRNINTWCEHGTEIEQSWAIARRVLDFLFNVHIERSLVPHGNFYLVCESFELRQMGADLSPVRVSHGFEVLLCKALADLWGHDDFYHKQSASEAKGFCTD